MFTRSRKHFTGAVILALITAACADDPRGDPAAPEPAVVGEDATASVEVLKSPALPVLWTGTVHRDDAPTGEVPECATVACQRFDLDLRLPPGIWNQKPGGLQVALRWAGFGDNLDLYVYHDGSRVGASDGIIATAQSTLVPMADNGRYEVYVAYDFDMSNEFGTPPNPVIDFEALAEVEHAPKALPPRPLLPDLSARPQRNVTFDVPPPIFFEAGVPTTSCFPSEIEEEGATLCLRFDQVLANEGEGPLEFRFTLPSVGADETGPIIQRVRASDGTFTERQGGEWEFHVAHDHFHYTGFALSRLWRVDEAGARGRAPLQSRRHRIGVSGEATTGRKVSFCIVDVEIDAWAEKGDAPRTYSAPACIVPILEGPGAPYLLQGLSAGWSDVYDWFLPDQYIEVSGLEDGLYILDTIVDPDDTILESDETNNCGGVYVRLSGLETASPDAELLGSAPPCRE